jgi:plasmid stability protein
MAVLTIRNLPDGVRDRLRKRAAAAGMSMEAQARAILAKASLERAEPETAVNLQNWVDRLYADKKPTAVVDDLLADRRAEVGKQAGMRSKAPTLPSKPK